MPATATTVFVRRRWNTPDLVEVAADSLWNLHIRDEPGGVCSALPRAFLCAYIWCDRLPAGALVHHCRAEPPAPHEVLVCILPSDNATAVFESLRSKARG